MGLAERRALKKFQDENFPDIKKQIDEMAGFEVNLEIDWEKISAGLPVEQYYGELSSTYFDPLISALRSLGQDEMGKSALKEGLKKIVITHDPATAIVVEDGKSYEEKGWPKFDDGVLAINLKNGAGGFTGHRREAIVKALEAKL